MKMSHKITSKLQFHIHIRHKCNTVQTWCLFIRMHGRNGKAGKYSEVSKERIRNAREREREREEALAPKESSNGMERCEAENGYVRVS